MKNRRPTQEDLARLAGVSQSAVSQVINRSENIAIPEETRQRVLRAVNQLRCIPNRSAQSLRTQKTFTIACVIPDITNPFYPAFQHGVQSVANQNNYDLIEKDHTRIGMIAGMEDTPPRQNRINGFCKALANRQLPMDDLLIQAGDFTESGGYEGMKKLLSLQPLMSWRLKPCTD